MIAPPDCPRPSNGRVVVWCRSGYCGGAWLVVDHTGRILTSLMLWGAIAVARAHERKL